MGFDLRLACCCGTLTHLMFWAGWWLHVCSNKTVRMMVVVVLWMCVCKGDRVVVVMYMRIYTRAMLRVRAW